jgi:hypothetical protein
MNLETQQNWFYEFWMNIQIDMNFISLNRIEIVLEIEKGFKIKSSATGRPRGPASQLSRPATARAKPASRPGVTVACGPARSAHVRLDRPKGAATTRGQGSALWRMARHTVRLAVSRRWPTSESVCTEGFTEVWRTRQARWTGRPRTSTTR